MQLQVVYNECRHFVDSTGFFLTLANWFYTFYYLNSKGRKKHIKKRLQFTQWKSKTPGAEERQAASGYFMHFLCKNRPSVRAKTFLLTEYDSGSVAAAPGKELSHQKLLKGKPVTKNKKSPK